ncbi:MAG: PD40 domain-containing protein [Sedimentisphaerales bacterium]|nr:PD40 domain-containing protein [Sedimentisphaerales bacterium]
MQPKNKSKIAKSALIMALLSNAIILAGLMSCQRIKIANDRNKTAAKTYTEIKQVPKSGKLAFISNREGIYGIYIMDETGNNQQNLTDNYIHEGQLIGSFSWSPDGKKIAFTLGGRLVYQLHVIDSDGSGFLKLTDFEVHKEMPSWSPDGKKIVFSSKEDIYLANADGSKLKKLGTSPLSYNPRPFWSSDGNSILFKSYRDNTVSINAMNIDGGGEKIVGSFFPSNHAWSPDGKKIVMAIYTAPKNSDIFIMNADGSEYKRLTNINAAMPSWSPDGKKIALTSHNEIYTMNADGREQKSLTNYPFTGNMSPCWSPDGKKIAFVSMRDFDFEIYIMDVDGNNQKRLTYNPGVDDMPCWSPN